MSKFSVGDVVRVLNLDFYTGSVVSPKVIGKVGIVSGIMGGKHIYVHFEDIAPTWPGDYFFEPNSLMKLGDGLPSNNKKPNNKRVW